MAEGQEDRYTESILPFIKNIIKQDDSGFTHKAYHKHMLKMITLMLLLPSKGLFSKGFFCIF